MVSTFEKVLVTTDFSNHAHKVLECVGDIPGIKEVVLLKVVSRPTLTRFWDPVVEVKDAEKKLVEEVTHIKAGVNVKMKAISVLEGEIANAIQRVAGEENVHLVVMGARGRSFVQSALLGSVSRNVLRFGDKHLLIMRYKTQGGAKGLEFAGAKGTKGIREGREPERLEKYCEDIFSKVLVPTDFSQPEEAASLLSRA